MIQRLRKTIILFAVTLTGYCAGKNSAGAYLGGSYTDTLTMGHEISNEKWNHVYPGVGTCERQVQKFDREGGSAVYLTGGSVCFKPSTYGKVFFVSDTTDAFWYCELITGKASFAEVEAAGVKPDATQPATGGCNGQAWIKLSAASTGLALKGNFSDPFGGSHALTDTLWTTSGFGTCTFAIIYYDNTNGFFLYQQQADAGCYAANNYKFGKVFWTVDAASGLYYCEQLYGQSSYLTVANSTAKPTYTNPSATGCGGFSWTKLTR